MVCPEHSQCYLCATGIRLVTVDYEEKEENYEIFLTCRVGHQICNDHTAAWLVQQSVSPYTQSTPS